MRKKLLFLVVAFALLTQGFLVISASAMGQRKAWTYIIYACADNNLDYIWTRLPQTGSRVTDLEELMMVGSTDLVNIVALQDLWKTNGTEFIYIEQGSYTVIEAYDELNMGDPWVCIEFVKKVKELYPAEKYVLDFWDHGGGWQYVCRDETNRDFLNMTEIRIIMETIGYIDIVAFDACNMAQAEVAYTLYPYAGYMVAYERTVALEGFDYEANLRDLVEHPSWTPRRFAAEMVINQGEYYERLGYNHQGLSAINLEWIPLLKNAFANWASAMTSKLDEYKAYYAAARSSSVSVAAHAVDLYDYLIELGVFYDNGTIDDIPLKQALKYLNATRNRVVSANCPAPRYPDLSGLAIYWPRTKSTWLSYRERYIKECAWAVESGWVNFLDAYFA